MTSLREYELNLQKRINGIPGYEFKDFFIDGDWYIVVFKNEYEYTNISYDPDLDIDEVIKKVKDK